VLSKTKTKTKRGRANRDDDDDDDNTPAKRHQQLKPEAFECKFSKKEWKIPTDRAQDYASIFTTHQLSRMPKAPGGKNGKTRPFCNKALCLGICRLGDKCIFNHSNPKDCNMTKEVDAFYKEAYGA
jgi:hypothetical protein